MIVIKKIQLKDLQNFVESKFFQELNDVPISYLRAASYINNPNKSEEDFVLYFALKENKLVGYRTILSDVFYIDNEKIKFGWLSGNWVHNDFRRKSVSLLLFNEIYKDWNQKLIFTNYAAASKEVYDKTKRFDVLKTLHGNRYYRRFCLAELLPQKLLLFQKTKGLLVFSDWLLNLFFDLRFKKNKSTFLINFQINKINNWNNSQQKFLQKFKEFELFKRNNLTYKWIQTYPWIKTDVETQVFSNKYYFSSFANIYNSNFYEILDEKTNEIIAIINISIKNKHLKIPYLYAFPEAIISVKKLIFQYCNKYQINYVTIYDEALNISIKNNKNPFLKQKVFKQDYIATKNILRTFKNIKNLEIQTGDGDGVFA